MSRRSSRLVSGGYYNSDEESDSSSVTNISYRENPVKVFKKKSGTRKASPRTSSIANSNASSLSRETPGTEGLSPSPLSSQTQPIMRTATFTTATPRPALAPSRSRSQTPTSCPTVPPSEKSSYTGHCVSNRPGLHLRPNPKELGQSGVDSSGYSSSEGTDRKPVSATSSTGGSSIPSDAPSSEYMNRINTAFLKLMDSASLMAVTAHSKLMHLPALVDTSLRRRMKKACALFLLLLIALLCIWFLLPLLTLFISHMTPAQTPALKKPTGQPVITATPPPSPPPPQQTNTMRDAPVVDPAVVSAVVEKKMQHLLAELQLKQQQLLSQMKEQIKLDMQGVNAKLEVLDSDGRLHLEQEAAALARQLVEYQTDSRSAASSLSFRIQALEAQNAKLHQELSSIRLMPPPAPCPEPSPAPVLDHLTPELQQAIERWLTDRIKEQDVLRLGDKVSDADCGRPVADKMADFALETQGASVISTRCSETYRIRSACVTLFGFPLWYPSESPRTVIQGHPVLLPGKCWAFHGVQGTLVISLSHPVTISHVTLDHLPRYNSPTGRIDSALKDFEVYGLKNDSDEGTLLGTFTYDEEGESTQTFELPFVYAHVYVLNQSQTHGVL
ncbi:hypothetical protein JOB18_016019 [Solea senegalensis]|uniref:SUN domain-containing protein n=1 Tax=Solea senegalensis TaxID=28829 RepID=A0AAV6Q9C3_SOLSE|nr:hypothetical protein JOB18_016019 [Solea senegalensis]